MKMNNFAYDKTLLFYEETIKNIEKKFGKKITLEQDGSTAQPGKAVYIYWKNIFK